MILSAAGVGIVRQMLADRVGEREPALLGKLPDGRLGERLVDRADVELRVGPVRDRERPVGHAVCLLEERRPVLRDQDDSGERSGLGELAQVRVGGRGDLGVGALARLAGRIGALGLLEAQPADSVGRSRIELQADLEPVARVLRAREEGRPVVASGEHLLEIERPDLLRHAGQALRPLVEGGFLESRLGKVRRDERANRVGRSGLEGLQQRLDPPAGGSVGRRGPLSGSRGGRRGEAQTQKDREGRRAAKSHASVYAPAPRKLRFRPGPTPSSSPGCPGSASSGPGRSSWTSPWCSSPRPPWCRPWPRALPRGCRRRSKSSGSP